MAKTRTIEEITQKIDKNTAVVITAQEFLDKIAEGEKIEFEDVDVITTATKGLMSGIAGIFSFRLAEPKKYRKFKEITLNGIPGYVGPCPNEFLGVIDVIVYSTAHSKTRTNYTGGFLFRDLVENKPIEMKAETEEGVVIEKMLSLKDMQFARLMGTRQAIKNYSAMMNPTKEYVETIFSALKFEPNNSQLTFSGCGALNPLQNDPDFETIGVGIPVLVNGSIGYVMGPGTRNYILKPNLMTIADFEGMKPEYMGAFMTSYGPEPICSIAVAFPILNEKILNNMVKSDKDVPLQILNLVGREKMGEITYGDVWDNNYLIIFDPKKCIKCETCPVETDCPTYAFTMEKGIDKTRCYNCGTCIQMCPENAFIGDLKSIKFEGKEVPVVLRQSDRFGAIKLAEELKSLILKGEFPLKESIAKIKFYKYKI